MIYYREIPQMEKKNYRQHSQEAQKLLLDGLHAEYGMTALPQMDRETHGKPYFPEYPQICFNYSHCRNGVLCGISEERIGVDAETVRPFRERAVRGICHPREWELLKHAEDPARLFTRLWVCKEAWGKYTGNGVFMKSALTDLSAVLKGAGQTADGAYIKVWELDDVFLCACAKKQRDLQLILKEI